MSKTLIGITAYGGLPFLEMAIRSVQQTVTKDAHVFVIVAKPGDEEMYRFLKERDISYHAHSENMGFPASINDLYDFAFGGSTYDNLICMGNDVVAMPGSIDAMIECAEHEPYEMVCGSEFNAQFLVRKYPEARKYFKGENFIFTDFKARPWELHQERRQGIEPHQRKDIRNLTLFKRSAFEKSGYDDVVFYPNGFFADNDICRRCDMLGVSACGLAEAAFFHFVSRTIHQNAQRDHGGYFSRNSGAYVHKWGGPVGGERYAEPYDGRGMWLTPEIFLKPEMRIGSREQEPELIKYWSTL